MSLSVSFNIAVFSFNHHFNHGTANYHYNYPVMYHVTFARRLMRSAEEEKREKKGKYRECTLDVKLLIIN